MTKTKQQIIDDGHAAKRLLDDPDLGRFLDEIREEAFAEFEGTAFDESSLREQAYNKIQGVEHVRRTLRSMVDNLTIEKKGK